MTSQDFSVLLGWAQIRHTSTAMAFNVTGGPVKVKVPL